MADMWNEIKKIDSSNLDVSKYVFEKPDAVAEAVLYKYPTYKERTVICCSTQSGCPVGCRFCGAGDNFVRSLTGKEIHQQVWHLLQETGENPNEMGRLQIMFMSMGEPMLNFQYLSEAIKALYTDYPKAALLISTSGPAVDYKALRTLSWEVPTVGLQFSVHESTDEARNKLIPFKKKLTLSQIAHEGERWAEETGRRPFFNYCVHDKNNSAEDVARLVALFKPETWECTLSVVCERDEHIAAANQRQRSLVEDFMGMMLTKGYSTRMFDPAGQDDIGGGCGQLWFVQDWMKKNQDKANPSIGRGLPVVHCPAP
jgi:23S rRNA (adenine2503-C2)-methyltransferase